MTSSVSQKNNFLTELTFLDSPCLQIENHHTMITFAILRRVLKQCEIMVLYCVKSTSGINCRPQEVPDSEKLMLLKQFKA